MSRAVSITRVRVIRSHVLGAGRYAEVGDILDLPEGTAIERMHSGSVEPAPPELAPEPPAAPAEPDAPQEPAEEAGDEPADPGTPKTTRGPRAGKEKS